MEWKFRKEFQIMPGVRMEYGKNGIKTVFTAAQPTKDLKYEAEKLQHQLYKPYDSHHEIKSASIGQLTSNSLQELKTLLMASNTSYMEVQSLLNAKNRSLTAKTNNAKKLEKSFFKFLYKKKLAKLYDEIGLEKDEIEELNQQSDLSTVNMQIDSEEIYYDLYSRISKSFEL